MPSIAHREDSGKYSLPFARTDNTVISNLCERSLSSPSAVLGDINFTENLDAIWT